MSAPRRALRLAIALALFAATFVAYRPLLGNGFVNYDDDLYITNNAYVRQGLSAESVRWAVTSFHGANWFPLTRISWMLDGELYGLEPRGFHLTSLLFHCANAVLVFLVLARMTGSPVPSAFVASVFAFHPFHVESVAWASARKDVISGFFALLTIVAYERSARLGASLGRGLSVFALLALALMAKPTAVAIPFLLLLLDEWPLRRLRRPEAPESWDPARLRSAVWEKLPLFILVGTFSALTFVAQQSWGTVQSLEIFPPGLRIRNALLAYASYLGKSLWPTGFAVFYPHPGHTLSAAQGAGAGALLLALSVLALRTLRRRPYLAVGWFWFAGTLVPVIGLVQVGQAAMADRYTYLPLIGLALAVAWGVRDLVPPRRDARLATGALAVVALAALALATTSQARVWRDSYSLFRHALRVTERNHVAHINLGLAHSNDGQTDEAAAHLRTALRFAPSSSMAHGILGEVRVRQGRPEDAIRHFRAALRRDESARWRAGLARAQLDLGRLDEALVGTREALRLQPERAELHAQLGLALLQKGELDGAVASCAEALRLKPELPEAHAYLGMAWAEKGQFERAISHYQRALQRRPDLAAVHAHLGSALAAQGRVDAAVAHLQTAVGLEPETAEHHGLLARMLERAGREREAILSYRAALALGLRPAGFLNNLAWLLATREDASVDELEAAVRLAEEAAEATDRRGFEVLDTLAVAYAAAGRPADAARVAQEALALAAAQGRASLAADLRARLAEYRRNAGR